MHDSPVWSSPTLRSVCGVVERSRHVRISVEAIEQVASWMAAVGRTLAECYGSGTHRFVADCAHTMYAGGNGLLEQLVVEFPR